MNIRVFSLALGMVCSACSRSGETRVIAPVSQLPVTADTGISAQLQRDLEASRARGESVVRLRVVSPDTMILNVGARRRIPDIQLEAWDSGGARVERFPPAFAITDRSVVTLERGEFVGLTVGRAEIVIGVTRPDPASGRRRMVEMTRLPVVVRRGP